MSGTGEREGAGGRVVIWLLLGLVVLFGGAYVAAHFYAGDSIARGTTISGVEVGGLTADEAVEELRSGLADAEAAPVRVKVDDGETHRLDPEDWGLAVDHHASVDQAPSGNTWSPQELWEHFTGDHELDAVVEIDEPKFADALHQLNEEVGTPTTEGAVRFEGSRVVTTEPAPGHGVDADTARQALPVAWLNSEPVSLDLRDIDPEIDGDDVREALNSFANNAVSGPVKVSFGKSRISLSPADFAPALSMESDGERLVPQLNPKKLDKAIKGSVSYDGAPVDATVELVKGKPKVVPAKPGVTYDADQLDQRFLEALARTGERTVSVDATEQQADFTTEDAKALNITEVVSRQSTHYPHADYRNTNIGRAAELIDGTVLKPGETFSLNDTVGERTRENGFTEGFMIANGIFKSDLGGGVSQMATTLFNGMFFAGLEDVEHKPHSFYINRYPVGREATVAWGSVDLKFTNDTDHGVLIHAWIEPSNYSRQGTVTVEMWSTKTWDITSSTGDRYNFTSPATRTLTTPDCTPNSGYGGFDIDVKRYFHRPGSKAVVRTENFHTTYTPSDTVICKKPGKDKNKDKD